MQYYFYLHIYVFSNLFLAHNMDEGNAPEGETKNTETADNPKRFKTDNQEANETEAGEASEREPGCSNSETVASASGDSEFRKCRNVKKRNYRKSCDEESSGSER